MPDLPEPEQIEARRERLRVALTSPDLRRAVHLIWVHFHRGSARWDDQLTQVDALLSGVVERALSHADRYDPDRAGPIPWLVGIALNLLREQSRFARRERHHVVPQHALGEEGWRKVLETLAAPAGESAEGPETVDLQGALGRMSPEQRTVLELRYLKNLSWTEAARTLGISEGAARVRGCRALQALRDQLDTGTGREA